MVPVGGLMFDLSQIFCGIDADRRLTLVITQDYDQASLMPPSLIWSMANCALGIFLVTPIDPVRETPPIGLDRSAVCAPTLCAGSTTARGLQKIRSISTS